MSSTLRIAVMEEQGTAPVTVFQLNGSLDASTKDTLESKAEEAIGSGASNLLFDLSGVDYMGSAGLRAFHAISKRIAVAETGPGKLKLVNPSDPVSRVLKTLGFDAFFEVHKDLDSALKSF